MRTYIDTKPFKAFAVASISLCMLSCATSKKLSPSPVVHPGIDITFTGEQVADTIYVSIAPIPTDTAMFVKEYVEAFRKGTPVAIPVKDKTAHISPDSLASAYNIAADNYALPTIRLRGNEHAQINVSRLSPLSYEIKDVLYCSGFPHSKEYHQLRSKLWKLTRDKYSKEEFNANLSRMSALLDTIMPEVHPEVATYILSLLDDDLVAKYFNKLPAGAENTLAYAHACALRNTGNREAAQQSSLESELATNATVAFSLNPTLTFV